VTRHLLIIGAQRSGTTYLHTVLDAHPAITMARPARPEPKVFLSDERSAVGLEGYRRAYFAHATSEVLLGEKSTSYLEDPAAAGRVADVLGTPEVVVSLRDPVERAVSNWRFSTDNGFESRPLEEALRSDLEGEAVDWDPTATSVSPFAYVRRGRYADYLGAWFTRFPGHVHVCFLAELVSDARAVADLYRRIGVDPGYRPAALGRVVNRSQEPQPELRPELVVQLRAYYAASDEELRQRLGRQLPWATRSRTGASHDDR
jgi:hypothetical protein